VRRTMLDWLALAGPTPGLAAAGAGGLPGAPSAAAGKRLAWSAMVADEPRRVQTGPPADPEVRDATLAERARAGDEAAFAELFRRHAPHVGRVCRRMLGPAADDAVSETFLRARRSLDGYAPDRPFRTWMLSIASHHCIDQLRRRSVERKIFADAEAETLEGPDPAPTPLRRITLREERAAVLAAIDALPEKYRMPLVLRYFNEMDYAAIGEVLGLERAHVGTLLFRARRMLRERLEAKDAP